MTDPEIIDALLKAHRKNRKRFTEWEQEFVESVRDRKYLSDGQREAAERILSSKSATRQDRAAARSDQWEQAEACDKCHDGVVVMRTPLTQKFASRSGAEVAVAQQYREAAFPCTCERGKLRKEWQGYRQDARDAWLEDWRTKEEWEQRR